MDFGRALARLIVEKGVSAAELSRRSGFTPGTISSYKSGRIVPTLDALQRLATALGCHVYEIVAKAEGVVLPVAGETSDEQQWREKWRALEPEARYAVERMVDLLPKEKK